MQVSTPPTAQPEPKSGRWSDAGFRLLVEHSRDLVCLHAPDGRYLYVSPSVSTLLGYRTDELVGRDPYDFFHPDDVRAHVRSGHDRVLEGQVNHSTRYRFRHRDGHPVWLETVAVPLFEDPTRPEVVTALLTTSRDVSAQALAAAQLVVSEERLRLALQAAGAGICDVQLPSQTGYFSEGYAGAFGYGAEDLPLFAGGWQPLVHPDDLTTYLKARDRMLTGIDEIYVQEVRRLHRCGHYVWVRLVGRVVEQDAAGRPVRLIGALFDVDERVRSVNALRDGHRRLAQSQRLASLGDWRSDVDDPRDRWSDEMYRILGLDPATTPPSLETFIACMHPDDRADFLADDQRALREGIGFERDSRLLRPDGSIRHIYSRTRVLRDGAGRIRGLYGTMQDITDRKRAEAELREARDAVRELSSHHEDELDRERKRIALDVHDELGQRLTAMKLQLELVQSQIERGRTEEARRTTEQMRELIEETMEVTRNVALNLRPPALDLGLEAALEWLAEDFSLRSEIDCTVVTANVTVPLDDRQAIALYRIAQESLTNVARHAAARRVQIRLARDGAGLTLSIGDDGVGFDVAQGQRTGHFGLLGMRERARRLGADFQVLSQPGAGSTVQVRLPQSQGPSA
jgi:PAS domain S-box-containing protein